LSDAVGRSSEPGNPVAQQPSPAFLDRVMQGLRTELSGDPGAYDPWFYDDKNRQFGFSRNRKPFDSTAVRNLATSANPQGLDSPGAMKYHAAESRQFLYRTVNPTSSSFRSRSLQRPTSRSGVPGAGSYTPRMSSIYANCSNSGAQLRSRTNRFGHYKECTTEPRIGPGSYHQLDGSLYVDAKKSMSRTSRLTGFGSSSAQRKLPVHARGSDGPCPGEHQPLKPRIRDTLQRPLSARPSRRAIVAV
jgi:hypothetical protein